MANAGVPKGNVRNTLASAEGIDNKDGKVNIVKDKKMNSIGIPYGQTPGIGGGQKENSRNALPSTAHVHKPASSNLMTGMSQNRGSGGNK